MNDPGTWQPSHRRSEETGAILDRAFDDAGQPVPVVAPEVYGWPDDAPEPATNCLDRVQLLREVFTVLETGEPHLMAARLEALKIVHRIGGLSIRDAAKKAGCSRTTLHRITRQMGHSFKR